MPHTQMDSAAHADDWGAVAIQPGLLAYYTSAQKIGATDVERTFQGDDRFIHFNCQLAGVFHGRIGSHRLEFSAGDMSCGCSAGERFHVRHCGQLQNIEVMVAPDVLAALAADEVCELLDAQRTSDVFFRSARASRPALRAAHHLTRLVSQPAHVPLRLHAATLEFLHWQLSAFGAEPERPRITPHERRLLLDAKDLLLQDLTRAPTIPSLAKAIGLNQCKLKQALKTQFGCTIYALFQRERMARARELLRQHNVTETALLMGYSNISHFSAAYCREFGTLPSRAWPG